jgi:hypothetical protein
LYKTELQKYLQTVYHQIFSISKLKLPISSGIFSGNSSRAEKIELISSCLIHCWVSMMSIISSCLSKTTEIHMKRKRYSRLSRALKYLRPKKSKEKTIFSRDRPITISSIRASRHQLLRNLLHRLCKKHKNSYLYLTWCWLLNLWEKDDLDKLTIDILNKKYKIMSL